MSGQKAAALVASPKTVLTNYRYDQTDQLNAADHSSAADETYAYYWNGIRGNHSVESSLHSRVASDGVFNYTYDNEGNLTTKTRISAAFAADYQTTYTWDYRNRLKSVTQASNAAQPVLVTTTYFYDALDRRIDQKVEAGGIVTYTQFAPRGPQ